MNGSPLPPKKEVALALLERGSVHVHMDPRAGGVVVPAWFKRQPQLVLQVGLNMPVPIPDLRVDEDGMSCTLSFNRSPFFCIVPWSAVFAMVGDDSRGMVWPEDVPPEVATQARAREPEPAKKSAAPRALTSVKPAADPARAAVAPVRGAAGAKTPARAKTARAETDGAPKARKPRAKKGTSVVSAAPEAPSTAGRGVLLSIPTAGSKATRPAPSPEAARARPAPPASPPAPAPTTRQASTTPEAVSPKPAASPEPATPPRKPAGGKTKREIPPYLRVVK